MAYNPRYSHREIRSMARVPQLRANMRNEMFHRLEMEVKAREIKELADKIGIGKTKTKRVRKEKVSE